jgi:hypothetical protein
VVDKVVYATIVIRRLVSRAIFKTLNAIRFDSVISNYLNKNVTEVIILLIILNYLRSKLFSITHIKLQMYFLYIFFLIDVMLRQVSKQLKS